MISITWQPRFASCFKTLATKYAENLPWRTCAFVISNRQFGLFNTSRRICSSCNVARSRNLSSHASPLQNVGAEDVNDTSDATTSARLSKYSASTFEYAGRTSYIHVLCLISINN